MAKMVAYLSKERGITDLLEFAEFVEDVEHGKHYIFRDGSRYLLNAPPTNPDVNPMVNVSIDTLVRLQQKAAEYDVLIKYWKGYGPCPDDYIRLAQILAE